MCNEGKKRRYRLISLTRSLWGRRGDAHTHFPRRLAHTTLGEVVNVGKVAAWGEERKEKRRKDGKAGLLCYAEGEGRTGPDPDPAPKGNSALPGSYLGHHGATFHF